ncbi:MAG TPA: hypothetical protein VD930_10300 [Gemmatimonadales bacterium]|nr:hypothetical protein [Gemmatimonadales bacterium]
MERRGGHPVVADASTRVARRRVRVTAHLLLAGPAISGLGCVVEEGSLAVSAGAPAAAAVAGTITDCGYPVPGAALVFRVQQNRPEQARPVDARIGPILTTRDGRYALEIVPGFAIPGQAHLQLQSVNGVSLDLSGPHLDFTLGTPPTDTLRFDADVGLHRGTCPS